MSDLISSYRFAKERFPYHIWIRRCTCLQLSITFHNRTSSIFPPYFPSSEGQESESSPSDGLSKLCVNQTLLCTWAVRYIAFTQPRFVPIPSLSGLGSTASLSLKNKSFGTYATACFRCRYYSLDFGARPILAKWELLLLQINCCSYLVNFSILLVHSSFFGCFPNSAYLS